MIDDGSTDNSGKICDDYKNQDNRIIVVHKGILIVLVVLGHSEISGIAASVINSFHMAAFFFLAGLTIMWTSYKINSR